MTSATKTPTRCLCGAVTAPAFPVFSGSLSLGGALLAHNVARCSKQTRGGAWEAITPTRCNVIRADGCQCSGVAGHVGPHTR